jgi:membrane protein YdbS with pleckstrin-like domain
VPVLFIYLFLTGLWLRFRWKRKVGTSRRVWDLLYVACLFLTPVALGIWALIEYGDRWTRYLLLLPFAGLGLGFLIWAVRISKVARLERVPGESSEASEESQDSDGPAPRLKSRMTTRRLINIMWAYCVVVVLLSLGVVFDKRTTWHGIVSFAIPVLGAFVIILLSALWRMRK